jgi:hypothetical protein
MKKGLSDYSRVVLLLVSGLVLAILVLMTPLTLPAASSEQIITHWGQKIPSIFDGLKPSRLALELVPKREKARNMSWVGEGRTLGRQFVAHLRTACSVGQCTPIACFGQFERATPCSGCCTDSVGCPALNNYTDSKNYDQDDQVKDEPCGADCCDDFANCPD